MIILNRSTVNFLQFICQSLVNLLNSQNYPHKSLALKVYIIQGAYYNIVDTFDSGVVI